MSAQPDAISDDLEEMLAESGSNSDDWETVDSDSDAVERMQQLVDQTPSEHPELPRHEEILGQVLMQRYLKFGALEDLNSGLEHRQQAINLTPKGHPDRPVYLRSLAFSLTQRYWRLDDLNDLKAAVECAQEAVELTSAEHPDRLECLHALAGALLTRYQRLGELSDLENAMKKFQQVVDVTPQAHPASSKYLRNLSVAFTERHRRFGDIKDLEAAMHNIQKAVDLTTIDDPDRADCLQNLAMCYTNRYKKFGNLDDLQAALKWDQEAVDLTPVEDPERAGYLQNLGASFTERYQRLGDLKDLETALQHNQEAVDLIPEDDPDRVPYLQSLSISFKDRFRRLGDLSDLEIALKWDQEAVDLTPADHRDKAARLQRLAVSFTERYRMLGDLKDLEAALRNDQHAVDLTSADDPERAKRVQSLGISFKDRYLRLRDMKDLQTALHYDQQAVDLTPPDNPDKAACLENLAMSLKYHYERLGDLKDLEASRQNNQEALNLIPLDHPDRAGYLHNLGAVFTERYQRLSNQQDLENAVQKTQEAIIFAPKDTSGIDMAVYFEDFAHSLRLRYDASENLKDLETAMQMYQKAVELTPSDHPDLAGRLQSLAVAFKRQYDVFEDPKDLEEMHKQYLQSFRLPTKTPESSWHAALEWASFAEEAEYALTAYSTAFRMLPEILWLGHAIPTRHNALHRLDVGSVASTAVKTCIKFNNLTNAVEIIEQGLATTFQQMLQLKPDVGELPTEQAQMLQKLSSELYSGTIRNIGDVAIERKYLLEEIHQQPGFEYFLLPKPYSVLCQAANQGPIVILNSHKAGCDGIIILNPTSNPVHVPLPDVTLDILKSQRDTLRGLIDCCGARTREDSASTRLFGRKEQFNYKSAKDGFADLLTLLWEIIVGPVYQVLASHGISKGRLWWLSTGAFTGLPLHACSPTDAFIHSYTPTLGSLLEAQVKKSSCPHEVGVVGVTHTGPGRRKYLEGVEEEVKNICSAIKDCPLQCLEGEQATPNAVKDQLGHCSWVHLACHGTQDLVEPIKSCLLLYEGELGLEKILQMPLSNAEFVFLAACQTAMGDTELVNESFHLGGGFIAAGFRSVVGTLWSMRDQDGPLVAERFYGHLFRDGRKPQASEAAEALQIAVKELKARNVPYECWIPFIHIGV
ncbi:CHAT domain-containing protein [Mycena galopus ATCC 62051]|nr:CHAT domain-containing protein [Mycena galopus ATCC 62051]